MQKIDIAEQKAQAELAQKELTFMLEVQKEKHRRLNKVLDKFQKTPHRRQFKIKELKKRKFQLKTGIQQIESLLKDTQTIAV